MKTSIFGCSEDTSSKYIVIGVPLDQSTTYKPGTRFAPEHIRVSACNLEFYSLMYGVSLDDLGFNDLGDVVVAPGDLDKTFENISLVTKGVDNEYGDHILFFLGGEHTITYPIIRSLKDKVEALIVFDAHLDMRDEYMGSRFNHATVMRRIYEELEIPVMYVGVRAFSKEEKQYVDGISDIQVYSVVDVEREDLRIDYDRVYVSIDMDVLDPSYAPGVSNPEPLGLSSYRLLKLLHRIMDSCDRVVGLDIVEVNPLVDVNDVTSLLASKILLEIVGFYESRSL